MAFQEFTGKGGKYTPQVSINNSGGFSLSSGLHHRYDLDRYEGVRLYFDTDTYRIGIKPVEQIEKGVFRLKKQDDQKGAFFAARSFMQANDLSIAKYRGRYTPEEIEDEQFGHMFVINLREKK